MKSAVRQRYAGFDRDMPSLTMALLKHQLFKSTVIVGRVETQTSLKLIGNNILLGIYCALLLLLVN